jgi:hypothetical protein
MKDRMVDDCSSAISSSSSSTMYGDIDGILSDISVSFACISELYVRSFLSTPFPMNLKTHPSSRYARFKYKPAVEVLGEYMPAVVVKLLTTKRPPEQTLSAGFFETALTSQSARRNSEKIELGLSIESETVSI